MEKLGRRQFFSFDLNTAIQIAIISVGPTEKYGLSQNVIIKSMAVPEDLNNRFFRRGFMDEHG